MAKPRRSAFIFQASISLRRGVMRNSRVAVVNRVPLQREPPCPLFPPNLSATMKPKGHICWTATSYLLMQENLQRRNGRREGREGEAGTSTRSQTARWKLCSLKFTTSTRSPEDQEEVCNGKGPCWEYAIQKAGGGVIFTHVLQQ